VDSLLLGYWDDLYTGHQYNGTPGHIVDTWNSGHIEDTRDNMISGDNETPVNTEDT